MRSQNTPAFAQQFKRYRPLIRELVTRDLKIKYRRSFLGYVWSLLNPLLMMTIMSIVFSYNVSVSAFPIIRCNLFAGDAVELFRESSVRL